MRPDQQKLRATQKSGRKDEAKDMANDRQLKTPSRQGGGAADASGAGAMRPPHDRQDKSDPHTKH